MYPASGQPAKAKGISMFWRVIFIILLIIGICVIYFAVNNYINGSASTGWPTAPGIVSSSSIETNHSGRGRTIYIARISYSYSVAGEKYNGTHVTSADYGSGDYSHAQG